MDPKPLVNASPAPDDAQRELEQRALRNVRGLVDKMETIERVDQGAQRTLLLWIVLGALAAVVILGVAVWISSHRQTGAPLVIESAKTSPVRPAPAPAPAPTPAPTKQ
jgi:type IV secretory pathway TrbD component